MRNFVIFWQVLKVIFDMWIGWKNGDEQFIEIKYSSQSRNSERFTHTNTATLVYKNLKNLVIKTQKGYTKKQHFTIQKSESKKK